MLVTFVLGLQGVGKSTYIKENFTGVTQIDFEHFYHEAPRVLTSYEKATYVKLRALFKLQLALERRHEEIVIECVGMTTAGQAAILALAETAWFYKYGIKYVYLIPDSYEAYEWNIRDDGMAKAMYSSYQLNGRNWRQPHNCPYFDSVEVVTVDHTHMQEEREWREHVQERDEMYTVAMGG